MAVAVKLGLFKPSEYGLSADEVIKLYDEWDSYEQDVLLEECVGHVEAAKTIDALYPKQNRSDVRILDIGAGTGLVGIELRNYGFSTIDALEPCLGMIRQAQERNIYEKYIVESLSDSSPCSIESDTYDCVVSVGAFCGTHISPECLREAVRITKPGGFIVIVVRRDLEENQDVGLTHVGKDLEGQEKIEIVQRKNLEKFRKGKPGLLFTFKVL